MTVIVVILVLAVLGLGAALVLLARRPQPDPAALLEQLVATNQAVMERGAAELGGRAALIDRQMEEMSGKLDRVTDLVRDFERDRDAKFGTLGAQLAQQQDGLNALLDTTQNLHETLSNPKARGRLGEWLADDILRLCEFRENVNYRKQRSAAGGGIPDFTFMLPNDLLLHMDVKFPLDNYWRCVKAESDLDRKRFRDDFLRDVRARVKELGSRDYVDPEGGTVDFALLFMPAEELYGFIHEHDEELLGEAIRRRVVLCSPFTLFTVLALIRQTVESFELARQSDKILALLGAFKKQWGMFVEKMDKLDRSLTSARRDYDDLVGTRRRALERPLDKIESLSQQQELSLIEGDDGDDPLALEA